jgi:hypothetical protein
MASRHSHFPLKQAGAVLRSLDLSRRVFMASVLWRIPLLLSVLSLPFMLLDWGKK